MSRSIPIIILGVLLGVGLTAVALFSLGRSYFTIGSHTTTLVTPASLNPIPADAIDAKVTPPVLTVTATSAVTTVIAVIPTSPTAKDTAVTPLPALTVLNTSVQFVLALVDLEVRRGPGTDYDIVDWFPDSHMIRVTGVSPDNGWWRVVCPGGGTGSCWVTADTRYTQPAQPTPVADNQPTATAVTTACTNSAALITDVTVPDGTQLAPESGFNKIWRLLNTGSCTWENDYKIIHTGGPLLGAMAPEFPLNATVYPGQFHDLIINMVSPEALGTYQSDWTLQNAQGQSFGIGSGNSPLWVRIEVTDIPNTSISGLIYQDVNENGIHELGEPLMAGREIRLVPSTTCRVDGEIVGTALSDADGRYTLSGKFNGDYCIGLVGETGFDDGVNVTLTAGQILTQFNLRAPNPNASISGYLWNDSCLADENGAAVEGVCVPDGQGGAHADGVIQATETYIPDVTVFLQPGTCLNNDHLPVPTSTDAAGQYIFTKLDPGTYCLSIHAAGGGNAVILLPGNWTYPGWGIWYQEINLQTNETVSSVNFGWDYQP